MKLIVIGDRREHLLNTLEVILKHWGYRVLVSSSPERVEAILKGMKADLLIMGSDLFPDGTPPLKNGLRKVISTRDFPLILLFNREHPDFEDLKDLADNILPVPINVFSLFQLIQGHLEKVPRRNMRLAVQLPAIISTDGESRFSEVLSLSVQGMFLKNSSRLRKGTQVQVLFPLLGMKKEMEVAGRVCYQIAPGVENNFLEGIGLEFFNLTKEDTRLLEIFIEKCFRGEMEEEVPPKSCLSPGDESLIDFKLKKSA
ncbi:MAG: PilZ domain-containing protein [Desulfuromonadaceae bacterium]|nr:PilZ domain-containing protein [Desulfuromonadaceae bacterium]